jgi:hypothetical protein
VEAVHDGRRDVERGVGLGVAHEVAMVVGAARCDEGELLRDGLDRCDDLFSERPVVDLQAAQPDIDELVQERDLVRRLREVGQGGQPPCLPDRPDRIGRSEALARDVGWPTPADEPLEGVLDALGEARCDEGPRDRRPAHPHNPI